MTSPPSLVPVLSVSFTVRLLRRFAAGVLAWLAFYLFSTPSVMAFPPSPTYTLYGIVRDQVGATLSVEGADLILLKDGIEVMRTPIKTAIENDQNYEMSISMDASRGTSRLYANRALPPQGVFSLVVEMNGQKFYPIEVAGTLRAGVGGERVKLDLTLGTDANRDGLPDAWQEWVLYQAGRTRGTPGWDINLITKDGDFDGDGISNYGEYIAGTFAGDATERFDLRIVDKTATKVVFEFYAITNKVYKIEESSDLKTWTFSPFATTPEGAAAPSHTAPNIGVQRAFIPMPADNSRYYRLSVR